MKVSITLPWPLWLTFVVFLILKLTGVIGWSWWLITAPIWGPCALILILLILGLACVGHTFNKAINPKNLYRR